MTELTSRIARIGLLGISLGWVLAPISLGQTAQPDHKGTTDSSNGQGKSVASVARVAKTNKTHAARVFTDDDMEVHKSPSPVMNLEGDDTTDLILRAIAKYKESHKPDETEQVVHDWYDEYDAMLAANAREAIQYRSLREANTLNGYDLCQQSDDYEHCEKRRQSELRGQRLDGAKIRQDMERVGRIQQGLMRVRAGIGMLRLNYPWFKVRNGNGIGSF